MESKHMLMSAFGVGIGVGLGLGLASGSQNVSRLRGTVIYTGITPLMMEHEILGLVVNGRDSSVTFDQFPYYLRLQLAFQLKGQACMAELKQWNQLFGKVV